jgi:hypothetical protein
VGGSSDLSKAVEPEEKGRIIVFGSVSVIVLIFGGALVGGALTYWIGRR